MAAAAATSRCRVSMNPTLFLPRNVLAEKKAERHHAQKKKTAE
jgi:hypothetical protein